MDWWVIVLIVIGALLFLFIVAELVISLYVTNLLIHPYCTPIDEAIERDINNKRYTKEDYEKSINCL